MVGASSRYYIVNAFSEMPFGGNPAAVMLLDKWVSDFKLQALAAQHNLSETAFLVQRARTTFELRWFTPVVEVPLCGHATLAAAHVLANELGFTQEPLYFKTRFRGTIAASCKKNAISIELPTVSFKAHPIEEAVVTALGARIVAAVRPIEDPWQVLYELESEEMVRGLNPNIGALAKAVKHCVVVTAEGSETDFVSRMFGPHYGVDEDPVTGSAHCILTPFWSQRLGKMALSAEQCSPRGGRLKCVNKRAHVQLIGHAVTFSVGDIVAAIY